MKDWLTDTIDSKPAIIQSIIMVIVTRDFLGIVWIINGRQIAKYLSDVNAVIVKQEAFLAVLKIHKHMKNPLSGDSALQK